MFIKVTHRSQAVDALLRGATLWCCETGSGLSLCSPDSWELLQTYDRSKRCVRRLLARWAEGERSDTPGEVLHFKYNFERGR